MSLSLAGKQVVVTGASSGIGLEIARGLAAQGARVIMVVRSRERGETAIAEIKRTAGEGAELELVLADLYSMAEVRKAAAEIRERCKAVAVLVNNAGLIHGKREVTVDGLERTFALNHMAYWLMTYELREQLAAAAPARVVCVASVAHKYARLELEDVSYERRKYKEIQAYGDSKLANILFAKEAAPRLGRGGVCINAYHPGPVATNFGQSGSGFMRFVMAVGKPFIISAPKGADTGIWLASSSEAEGMTGQYLFKRKPRAGTAAARDMELAKGLWALSERIAGVSWS